MRNIFKRSKDVNLILPNKIPDALFNENTPFHVEHHSRISPRFDDMLDMQHARQSFLKYLRSLRLQDIFQCFLELKELTTCSNDCDFDSVCDEKEMDNFCDLFIRHSEEGTVADCLRQLELFLNDRCGEYHKGTCVHVHLYRKYLSVSDQHVSEARAPDCIEDTHIVPPTLVEAFLRPHHGRVPTLDRLRQSIGDNLRFTWYPEYLQSKFHQKYQLQLLNSGLNTLRLSDFLYSDQYVMLMIEFLDNHGLSHYLFFLLAIIRLLISSDKCSFQDALDIYTKFLVMDSSTYLDVPSNVANSVVNIICQHELDVESAAIVDVSTSFQCAFKPVYLFLEQFWLPQFLISPDYYKHVNYLNESIFSYHPRNRIYSDTTTRPSSLRPCDVIISEDDNSDISVDNASVQSEPAMSLSETVQPNPSGSSWWPSRRLDHRLSSSLSKPMTLGSFDDLGRYQSINSSSKYHSNANNSTSSEILSTISELSNDIWNKVQFNDHHNTHNTAQSPDDVARQIINDIHQMTLKNL